MKIFLPAIISCLLFFSVSTTEAQLQITAQANAQALAQKLVGEGVSISNVTFTGISTMAGFFNNISGTNIGLDSGIVLTNGRSSSMMGNNTQQAINILADNSVFNLSTFSGDAQLAQLVGVTADDTHDACILEFDFVPLGDQIKFRYVFSSEEYPDYACNTNPNENFNDAFAFFISGPGITGNKNIALIPGSTEPVTINNINDQGCAPFPQFYINNESNRRFTHNGHTMIFTAAETVQPCQSYHLKLVIADVVDGSYDSGVFLESGSLTSNVFQLINLTQTDPATGMSYLVEGCATGALKIKRQGSTTFSQTVFLAYGGSALNSVDVQTLPSSVVIPAGETEVSLSIIPIMDLVPEGIELLEIYTLAPCSVGPPLPTDTASIQIRDYDILGITPDTANICRNGNVQLQASPGYTTYTWDNNITLSSNSLSNPVATPVSGSNMYYCTASVGTCRARDSAFVRWKDIELLSKQEIFCKNGTNGQIRISAGPEWVAPLQLSINNAAFQPDSTFNNLAAGGYMIRVKDAAGCIDSFPVSLMQLFPDLNATTASTLASCSGNPDGNILINVSGGKQPYLYSINNGVSYQPANNFNVNTGNHSILIKDNNGCTSTQQQFVGLNNDLTVEAGDDLTICEGKNIMLNAVSNARSFSWTPAATLSSTGIPTPLASPVVTTKYYVNVLAGICANIDSVTVHVNAAPKANAGNDITICYGAGTQLSGSGGVEYKWSPATYLENTTDAGTKVIKPLNNINYLLQVRDAKGCFSLIPDTVKIKVTPAVKMFAGRDTSIAFNQPLQLHAYELENSGVTTYTWSPSFGLSTTIGQNPVVRIDHDMTYTVTGKTPADCEGSDDIFVKAYKGPEIYVPTAFTPNNDGRNDLLKAIAIGMREYHYFIIYNRWGQMVFTTKDFTKGWDGKMQGALQSPGTYVWIAETVDFTGKLVKRNGSTILLR